MLFLCAIGLLAVILILVYYQNQKLNQQTKDAKAQEALERVRKKVDEHNGKKEDDAP